MANSFWKVLVYRSEDYLAFVRRLPCLACNRSPSEAHHTKKAGTGLKGDDTRAVPLCTEHHREHDNLGRETFQKKYGLDFKEAIINCLSLYVAYIEEKLSGRRT